MKLVPSHRAPVTRGAAGGALLGLAITIALAQGIGDSPHAGQLPGFAAQRGFDPHADIFRLLLYAVGSLLGGWGGAAAGRLSSRSQSLWAKALQAPAAWIGLSVSLPVAVLGGDAVTTLFAGIAGSAVSAGLHRWRAALRTELYLPCVVAHALTCWLFLVVPASSLGISPLLLLPMVLALSVSLAAALGGGEPERGGLFLAASCLTFPVAFWGRRPNWVCLTAGLAAMLLPVLLRVVAFDRRRLLRLTRVLTVAIFLPGSVTAMAVGAVHRAPPVGDLFEDGHALLPASEYLRGEKPYRDIVPGHGLLSDGLLQAVQLKVFGDDYRGLRHGEKVVGALFWPSFYALGYAATGSAAFGFSGLVLSFFCFPQFFFLRVMAALWVLALGLYAARTKRAGAWLACGAFIPVALCAAVEFSAYSVGAVLVALLVARGRRLRHLRQLVLGAVLTGSTIALMFLAAGFLGDSVRATISLLGLLPAYGLGAPPVRLGGESLAAIMASLADRTVFLFLFAAAAVILLGALLPLAPCVGQRARAVLPVLAWIVLAMLSVLERHHVGYPFFGIPVASLLLLRWIRGHRPWRSISGGTAVVSAALLVLLWQAIQLTGAVADGILHGRVPPDAQPLPGPPRARGALFSPGDLRLAAVTAQMLRTAELRPDETWLDFANAPGLYYLFNRDCPIRYYEVPFYESTAAQLEVIEAVRRNRRVRAVLVASGRWEQAIDGVPNAVRAPLVAAFVRTNFRPAYRKEGVEFWLRKEAPAPDSPPDPATLASDEHHGAQE